jgi:hypothetical protein
MGVCACLLIDCHIEGSPAFSALELLYTLKVNSQALTDSASNICGQGVGTL